MCRVTDDPCVLLRECGLIPSGWQLVVAAGPPSGVRLYSSGVRWRGWFFSRGGRKPQPSPFHLPAGGGVLVCRRWSLAFFPGRRVRGAGAPAGGGCEVRYGDGQREFL